MSLDRIKSANATIPSPNLAVSPKIPPPRSPTVPNNDEPAFTTATNTCFTISTIANSPLKVRLRLSEAVSLSLNFEVRFFKPSVNPTSFSAVIGGNISRNASLMGVMTLFKPSYTFLKDSIKSSLPPKTFQFSSNSLRDSADLPMIAPIVSLTFVNNSFASSKSPTRISQV